MTLNAIKLYKFKRLISAFANIKIITNKQYWSLWYRNSYILPPE